MLDVVSAFRLACKMDNHCLLYFWFLFITRVLHGTKNNCARFFPPQGTTRSWHTRARIPPSNWSWRHPLTRPSGCGISARHPSIQSMYSKDTPSMKQFELGLLFYQRIPVGSSTPHPNLRRRAGLVPQQFRASAQEAINTLATGFLLFFLAIVVSKHELCARLRDIVMLWSVSVKLVLVLVKLFGKSFAEPTSYKATIWRQHSLATSLIHVRRFTA